MVVVTKEVLGDVIEEYAKLLMLAMRLEEALVWCGGSPDFAPEGQAHEGWKKGVAPILTDFCAYKKEKERTR